MTTEDIKYIKSQIKDIENIISPLEEYLIDNPNDFAVKLELKSFKKRLNELYIELGLNLNDLGLTTFDIYISNVAGGKIKLSNFLKAGHQFQETLISCSMYDGKQPIHKKTAPSQEILENIDPLVEVVQTGSLKLILSSNDSQTKFSNETTLKKGLENLNEIISCGDDKVKLTNLMKNMGTQPIFRYKKLLKILKDNELNLDMYNSVIPKGFKSQSISNEFAKKVYEVINEADAPIKEKKCITGELYHINSKTKRCGIEVIEEDTGKSKSVFVNFKDSFKEDLKNKLYSEITVSVERMIEHTLTDDEIITPFDLVKIH